MRHVIPCCNQLFALLDDTDVDALQLAAAIIAADGSTSSLAFMTLDVRLAEAAEREGFDLPLSVLG